MSAFSEYCRQLLLESGSNVYRIAKQSNLDRTSIQRMITGKRLPSIQFVEQFCSFLHLSSSEKDKLLELYKIEKIGMDLYLNRQYIKNTIESMDESSSYIDVFTTNVSNANMNFYLKNNYFAESCNETNQLLEFILYKELTDNSCCKLYTNIPTTFKFFYYLVEKLYKKTGNAFGLYHLLILNKAPAIFSKSNYNLEILHELLPFITKFPDNYFPKYIYSKGTSFDDSYYIYPYYLISPNYVICISSDFKTSALYNDDSVINHYLTEFKRLNTFSMPLIQYNNSCENHLAHIVSTIFSKGKPSHILSSEFLSLIIAHDSLKPVASLTTAEWHELRKIMNNRKKKCQHFFPADCFKNISMSAWVKESLHYEVINHLITQDFHIPLNLSILLYDDHSLILLYTLKDSNSSISIELDESDLCHSFLDFFDSMEESGLCHSAINTIDIISSINK